MKASFLSEVKLPTNAIIVTNPDQLKSSGQNNHGFTFTKGDRVEFPSSWDETACCLTYVGTNRAEAYWVSIKLNGKPMAMPMGSIRRKPYDFAEQLKPYPTNLELITMCDNDYERIEKLFGKTLVVDDIVELDFTVYDRVNNTNKLKEDGSSMLRKLRVPIFRFA